MTVLGYCPSVLLVSFNFYTDNSLFTYCIELVSHVVWIKEIALPYFWLSKLP